MSRIRTIKPDFFKDEKLAELSLAHRYLFEGLWTLADREGRLEDRPRYIKVEIFPYDKIEVDNLLNDLHSRGFIIRYLANGRNYIQIVNFSKHQRPNSREAESVIPEFQGNNHENLKNESTSLHAQDREEGKGREGKGKGMEKDDSTALLVSSDPPKKILKKQTDQEFFESLKTNPAYTHVDIEREWGKCTAWCELRQKLPTRQRFINWLNRTDQFLGPAPPGGGKSLPGWVERREREMREGAGGGNVSS